MKKTSAKRPRQLQQILASTDGFSELAARVQAMVQVQTALDESWPGLTLRVISIRTGVLTLRAPSPGLVAKARQSQPSLLAVAQKAYAPVQSIRIKAAKGSQTVRAQRQSTIAPLSEPVLTRLEQTQEGLTPGPVRDALSRMTARRR